MADMKRCQEDHYQELRSFIQQELQVVKDMLAHRRVEANQSDLVEQEIHALDGTLIHEEVAAIRKSALPKDEHDKPDNNHVDSKSKEEVWKDLQASVTGLESQDLFWKVMQRNKLKGSVWHDLVEACGFNKHWLPHERPQTWLASTTDFKYVKFTSVTLILSNTALMAYETDRSIDLALTAPGTSLPGWIGVINNIFTFCFSVELIYRLLALRLWFFVGPGEWHWNLFDLALVVISLVTDLIGGIDLTLFRSLRLFRVVRVARVIRVLRFFRELRKMLLSIIACLASLAWALGFLTIIILIVSIFFLQGAAIHVEGLDALGDEYAAVQIEMSDWYGSLGSAMFSLLVSVLGGMDWLEVRAPLVRIGWVYSSVFVLYVIFINVGILNVLTGVFLSSTDEFIDRDLSIQNENVKLDKFVKDMIMLFDDMDEAKTGRVTREQFLHIMDSSSMEAYLASEGLEPLHSRLLWSLLDEESTGIVTVEEFVAGLMRLKGNAKAIDARSIQRSLAMLPDIFTKIIPPGCCTCNADIDATSLKSSAGFTVM